jgi:hypothetical protein
VDSVPTSTSAGSAEKCYAWVALPCPKCAITKFVMGLGASKNANPMIPPYRNGKNERLSVKMPEMKPSCWIHSWPSGASSVGLPSGSEFLPPHRLPLTMASGSCRNIATRKITRTRIGSKLLKSLFPAPFSAPLGKPSAANPQVARY